MNALIVAAVLAASSSPKVAPFSALEVGNGIFVQVAPGPTGVKVDADDDVLKQVEVTTKGDVLVVKLKDGYRLDGKKVTVSLTSPALDRVSAGGGAHVTGVLPAAKQCALGGSGGAKLTLRAECGALSADASGGAQVTVQGAAPVIKANVSGGSDLDVGAISTGTLTAEASGGAKLHVNVTGSLTARLSGGCQLFVAGKPTERHVDASGGSKVIDG